MDLVNKRFGPPVRSNPFGELTHLRRTGTVREYEDQFLQLLARCEHVTERQQIDIFTAGLRNPLRIDVELQRPDSMEDAMGLARAFERRLEINDDTLPPASRPSSRAAPSSSGSHPPPSASTRTPPLATSTLPPATPPAPTKGAPAPGTRFKRLSSEEMARRRVEGLCFNCPEKFTPGHLKHCTMKGIYLMELDDDFVQVDDADSDEEPKISIDRKSVV